MCRIIQIYKEWLWSRLLEEDADGQVAERNNAGREISTLSRVKALPTGSPVLLASALGSRSSWQKSFKYSAIFALAQVPHTSALSQEF